MLCRALHQWFLPANFYLPVSHKAAAPHHLTLTLYEPTTKHESMSNKQTQNATICRESSSVMPAYPHVHDAFSLFTALRVNRGGRALENCESKFGAKQITFELLRDVLPAPALLLLTNTNNPIS